MPRKQEYTISTTTVNWKVAFDHTKKRLKNVKKITGNRGLSKLDLAEQGMNDLSIVESKSED